MICREDLSAPLPLHLIDELVGGIRAHARLARIEAESATAVAEQMTDRRAESLTCASVAEIERAVTIARTKRERAEWLDGLLADAERDAAALRGMRS